jgi:TPR repeat protein
MIEGRMTRGLTIVALLVVLTGCATTSATPPAPEPSSRATAPPPAPSPPTASPTITPPGPEDPARADLEAGRARIGAGDMTGAVTALRQALRREPDLVEARASLGLALHGMGDFDGAIDELRAALRQRPDLDAARLTLASALMARHDWAGARAELEEILAREPDAVQPNLGLASVRYAQGDINGAIAGYQRVLAREPEQHDARYNLALMLKLARRDADATAELLPAAQAGIPKAQYFVGAAYAQGIGIEKNLVVAVGWWFRAAEQGVAQAEEALAQLRQAALGRGRRPVADRHAAAQAFRDFRAELWKAYPSLSRADDDSVGSALIRAGRMGEAVPVLIRETLALSDAAERRLETLYEHGEGPVAPYDPRILACFRTAADDGEPRARVALARVYARGLGVPRDLGRAVALLRATPHEEAQRLLQELSPASSPAPPGH